MRHATRRLAIKALAVVGAAAYTGLAKNISGVGLRRSSKDSEPVRVAFSPNGKYLAIATGEELKVYDSSYKKVVYDLAAHKRPVHCLAYSNGGGLLASGDGHSLDNQLSGAIRIWDLKSGKQLRVMEWKDSDVSSVCFAKDNDRIVAGGAKGLRIWRTDSGDLEQDIAILGGALAVAISPDGRLLAHGGFDEVVSLRDTKTWDVKLVLKRHPSEIRSLSFSNSGEMVASGGVGEVKLWTVGSGDLLRKIKVEETAWSIVFSLDDASLGFGTGAPIAEGPGVALLYDARSGENWWRRGVDEGGVVSLSNSPDARHIAFGTYGGKFERQPFPDRHESK
jgi:WD40 repeat protein